MIALRRRFRGIEGDLDSLLGVMAQEGADLPWVLRQLLAADGS